MRQKAAEISAFVLNLYYIRHQKGKSCFCRGGRSFAEVKELPGGDLQHLAEFENHVEGHADIAQLDGRNVASVNIDKLGQFELGQTLPLAVIDDVQTKLLVVLFIFRFHAITSSYCRRMHEDI